VLSYKEAVRTFWHSLLKLYKKWS